MSAIKNIHKSTIRGQALPWLLLAIACVVLVFYVVRSLREPVPIATQSTPDSTQPVEPEEIVLEQDRLAPMQAVNAAQIPLPPANVPVVQLFDVLKQRADSGDSRAACRLGMELGRCVKVRELLGAGEYPANGAAQRQSLRALGAIDRQSAEIAAAALYASTNEAFEEERSPPADLTQQYEDIAKRCDKLTPQQLSQDFYYIRQAALAGQPDAMFSYIDGVALDSSKPYAMFGTPEFDLWRNEASALLQRALAQGHADAAMLLWFATSPSPGPSVLAGLYKPNAQQSATYMHLYFRAIGAPPPKDSQMPQLDVRQRAMAKVQADALFDRHFAKRPPPKKKGVRASALFSGSQRTLCDD